MTEIKYLAPADEFPKKGTSASGTDTAYTVEARMAYHRPEIVAGHNLDLRWSRVSFEASRVGVPNRPSMFPLERLGLLSYQAAQALRWWFVAEAAKDHKHLCVETRLVEHEVKYSYSETAERACAQVGGEDDRSHMHPPDAALSTAESR